jgi:hypothetical protein
VSLKPAAARALDIGHVDIYTSTEARMLFWQPILDWLSTH